MTELSERDQIRHGQTQLLPEETAELHRITAPMIAACAADPGPGDPLTPDELFNELRIRRVSLNDAGEHGLLVQGSAVCMCGATGNCNVWLLDETPLGAKVILRAIAVEGFAIGTSAAHGRFDLITGSHSSAFEQFLQKFRFDGVRYRRASCALMDFVDYPSMKPLKTPVVTETRCSP